MTHPKLPEDKSRVRESVVTAIQAVADSATPDNTLAQIPAMLIAVSLGLVYVGDCILEAAGK